MVSLSTPQKGLYSALLGTGSYQIEVSGWNPTLEPPVTYQLSLGRQFFSDNPPPLVNGPTPALVLHFGETTGSPLLTTPPPSSVGGASGPLPLLPTGGSTPTSGGGTETWQLGGGSASSAGELSGMSTSHLGLASLAIGPLWGGVGSGLQTEIQATPCEMLVSGPTGPVQTGLCFPA